MTRRQYNTSTMLGIVFVLALFSAAWCADRQESEAGAGAGSHAGYVSKALARGLDAPGSIVCGPRGNHYVAAQGSIVMISPDGDVSAVADGLPAPLVLAAAPDGSVYAAAPAAGNVYRIAQDGRCTLAAQGLPGPAGIAVDRDGNFIVSLAGSGEVVRMLRTDACP